MSPGAKDLPDPIDKPPLGDAPGADDLLARMAGEEIDRLLADAEVARAAEAPLPGEAAQAAVEALQSAGDATQTAAGPERLDPAKVGVPVDTEADGDIDGATARQLDAMLNRLGQAGSNADQRRSDAPGDEPPPVADRPPQQADEALSEELEHLYKQLGGEERQPAGGAIDRATAAQTGDQSKSVDDEARAIAEAAGMREAGGFAVAGAAAHDVAAPAEPSAKGARAAQAKTVIDPAEQSGEAERRALATLGASPESQGEADYRVPLYIRVLIWLNRPIENCSDLTRRLVGRAAVLTLAVAAAVLIWVQFFRK